MTWHPPLAAVNSTHGEPIDIALIKGRQRAEDLRHLAAGEVTPDQLQWENSLIHSADDILYVDLSPKGTPEQWARIIERLRLDEDSYLTSQW